MNFEDKINGSIYTNTLYQYASSAAISEDSTCPNFTFIIYVPIYGIIGLFGLVGNSLSFVVLRFEKRHSTATFLLQCLAVADNMFLLSAGTAQSLAALNLYYRNTRAIIPYLQVWVWPLVHITQMLTVWITLLIALNRYNAICRPFLAPSLCTMSRVRRQVIMVTTFALFYNIPRWNEHHFEHARMYETNQTYLIASESAMLHSQWYRLIYLKVLYCLFVFLGPLMLLIGLTTCLIMELWRARTRLMQLKIPIIGESNLTIVMVTIMLMFVISQTPAFINQLLADVTKYVCGGTYYYFYHVSNVLVSANSSINFLVYCAFRQNFRDRLKRFCVKQRRVAITQLKVFYNHNGKTDWVSSNAPASLQDSKDMV